jgi:hypothetical protein
MNDVTRDMAGRLTADLDDLRVRSCDLASVVARLSRSDQFLSIIQDRISIVVRALDKAGATAYILSSADDVNSDSVLFCAHNLRNLLDVALANLHGLPCDLDPLCRIVMADIKKANNVARAILDNHVHARSHDESIKYVSQPASYLPSRMALGLVRYALRIVPVGHRCRYDEEFRADLTELARDKGRWIQMGYAFQVLVRGLALRWALRGAVRERVEL